MLLSLLRRHWIENIEQKLNIKSENLVLPKEWVENALINLYWSKKWPHPNNT